MNLYLEKFIKDNFDKPGRALDLGAGKFYDVACLKQLGWDTDGVDINTGADLEKAYISNNRPYDLVYSLYLLHKLNSKEALIKTAYKNLKPQGWFFLHTFHKSDKISDRGLSKKYASELLEKNGFHDIQTNIIDYYDNEIKHKHWHKILQIIAKK